MKLLHLLNFHSILIGLFLISIQTSCKKDKKIEPIQIPTEETGVSVNLDEVPYQKLSDYRFFKSPMKNQIPNDRVLPYLTASTLFTDYAHKNRFIWMPLGVKASYNGDHDILDFPVGTVLIKNFYYEHMNPSNETKIIETRVMILKSTGWIFAEYVWNDAQTEAYLDMNGSYKNISFVENGESKSTNYRIPSEMECLTCHKDNNKAIPIGPKPQNINFDYTYSDGSMNQLQKLINVGYLENNLPGNIVSIIDYNDETQPLRLRLRSYLDINCAHCHRQNSHCSYRPLRFAFSETTDSQNMGICVEPEEQLSPTLVNIIVPGNVNKSMMHFRMSSTAEENRMPLLGRTLVHEEGVQLLEDFITSINTCD
ncbi:MAG TPA: hypothetical protein PLI97_12200 [Fluviicola sp.]|nr:hypothetical protein [Fluviicola sp.]